MRYLTLGEVLLLHERVLEQSGGAPGLRDLGALQSALAQPTITRLSAVFTEFAVRKQVEFQLCWRYVWGTLKR